jgi:hypothetical protein
MLTEALTGSSIGDEPTKELKDGVREEYQRMMHKSYLEYETWVMESVEKALPENKTHKLLFQSEDGTFSKSFDKPGVTMGIINQADIVMYREGPYCPDKKNQYRDCKRGVDIPIPKNEYRRGISRKAIVFAAGKSSEAEEDSIFCMDLGSILGFNVKETTSSGIVQIKNTVEDGTRHVILKFPTDSILEVSPNGYTTFVRISMKPEEILETVSVPDAKQETEQLFQFANK